MRAFCFAGVVATVLFDAALVSAAEPIDAQVVDRIVKDALSAWRVPGVAVALVRDGEVIYLKGFGVREQGRDAAVTADTLFPLASCTKAFTTTALAMLVEEGKVAWDDPVRKYVPYFHLSDPAADALVSVRDLVCHRTGLASHDLLWYRSPSSREEIIRRIGKAPLKNPFRASFEYQSTMFTVAGAVVESASGRKWDDFVRRCIFTPLGMTQSNFTTTAAGEVANRASPHRPNEHGELDVIPWYSMPRPEPAGSINSTARDLSRWLLFQLGDGTFHRKRLISAKGLAETHAPQNIIPLQGAARNMNPETHLMCYGMGWVLQDYRGHYLIQHAGAIDGFRAHLTLVPDAKLGIALLNNRHNTQMNLALSNQLVDMLVGLSAKKWNDYYREQVRKRAATVRAAFQQRLAKRKPGTKPTCDLAAYAGTYENPVYGVAKVVVDREGLAWKWNSFYARLEHFENDTFVLMDDVIGYPLVHFSSDRDGTVTAMRFAGGLEDVEFQRMNPKK